MNVTNNMESETVTEVFVLHPLLLLLLLRALSSQCESNNNMLTFSQQCNQQLQGAALTPSLFTTIANKYTTTNTINSTCQCHTHNRSLPIFQNEAGIVQNGLVVFHINDTLSSKFCLYNRHAATNSSASRYHGTTAEIFTSTLSPYGLKLTRWSFCRLLPFTATGSVYNRTAKLHFRSENVRKRSISSITMTPTKYTPIPLPSLWRPQNTRQYHYHIPCTMMLIDELCAVQGERGGHAPFTGNNHTDPYHVQY